MAQKVITITTFIENNDGVNRYSEYLAKQYPEINKLLSDYKIVQVFPVATSNEDSHVISITFVLEKQLSNSLNRNGLGYFIKRDKEKIIRCFLFSDFISNV